MRFGFVYCSAAIIFLMLVIECIAAALTVVDIEFMLEKQFCWADCHSIERY